MPSAIKQAAQAAKDVIDMIGTTLPDIYKVDNISAIFYNNDDCDELILRRVAGNETGDLGMETRHFAPAVGLIGAGKCNPSQNLVDALSYGERVSYRSSGCTTSGGYVC